MRLLGLMVWRRIAKAHPRCTGDIVRGSPCTGNLILSCSCIHMLDLKRRAHQIVRVIQKFCFQTMPKTSVSSYNPNAPLAGCLCLFWTPGGDGDIEGPTSDRAIYQQG